MFLLAFWNFHGVVRRGSRILVRGAQWSFWPQGGAPEPNKIGVFPKQLPENCMILKKSWGQGRGAGPPGPPGSAAGSGGSADSQKLGIAWHFLCMRPVCCGKQMKEMPVFGRWTLSKCKGCLVIGLFISSETSVCCWLEPAPPIFQKHPSWDNTSHVTKWH